MDQSTGTAEGVEGRAGSRSVRKWTAATKSRPVASITKSMALKFSSQRKQRPRLVRGFTALSDSPQRGQTKQNLPLQRLQGQFISLQ